ncbi:MAG: hypothetical protein ACXAEN_14410 [Candidatus Thorarchaeota archaeon]
MYGLNPLENDTQLDADEDGLSNFVEFILRLNPASNDTDSDLMPDGWEVLNYLNPLFDDSGLDPDGDGLTNIEEYLAGSNPNAAPETPVPTTTTTPTTTTSTPTTSTTPTQPPDVLPLVLAAGGVSIGVVLVVILFLRKRTE